MFEVGGAINGGALESGSWKYGQFNDLCISFDVVKVSFVVHLRMAPKVLGDGSLITCSSSQNQDLFYGLSGAYGTLGIIVCVTLQVVPGWKIF